MSPTQTSLAAQQQVLALISTGSTIAASAREAGIHRNTIYNWFRLPAFRDALERARYENAVHWHERSTLLVPLAVDTLTQILQDPEMPASVRARIALAILNRAATPLPPPPLVHSLADTEAPGLPEIPEEIEPPKVPKSAQSVPMHSAKTGRNEPCPCGSGVKFKRCCLNKRTTQPPAGPASGLAASPSISCP